MDITIFIRAKNEGKFIAQCLTAIFEQETSFTYQVIILDSGSNDNTIEIASRYPVTIYSVPSELFHYARALNFGIAKSDSTYFISLSAHAIPFNKSWLEELVSPLLSNPEIAASFSRQVGLDSLSQIETRQIKLEFPDDSKLTTPTIFKSMLEQGIAPYSAGRFSNVSSCIRTKIAKVLPFREIPYSEDRLFALEALSKGYQIAYNPKSIVRHSHYPTLKEFQSVAYKAALARFTINNFILGAKNAPSYVSAVIGQMKIPIVVLWVALLTPFKCLLNFKGKLKREIDFRVACIGTTIGKAKALAKMNSNSPNADVLIADPTDLLQNASVVKSKDHE